MDKLTEIIQNYAQLDKDFNFYQKRHLNKNQLYPLDYIMATPKQVKKSLKMDAAIKRRNIIKNCVLRTVMNNRATRKRNVIGDIVNWWMNQKKLDEELMTKRTGDIRKTMERMQSNSGKPFVDEKFGLL